MSADCGNTPGVKLMLMQGKIFLALNLIVPQHKNTNLHPLATILINCFYIQLLNDNTCTD